MDKNDDDVKKKNNSILRDGRRGFICTSILLLALFEYSSVFRRGARFFANTAVSFVLPRSTISRRSILFRLPSYFLRCCLLLLLPRALLSFDRHHRRHHPVFFALLLLDDGVVARDASLKIHFPPKTTIAAALRWLASEPQVASTSGVITKKKNR